MQDAQTHIEKQSDYLECSLRGVINEHYLQKYISDDHWNSLNQQVSLNCSI